MNIYAAAPEIFVLCMACAVLIAAAFEPVEKKGQITYWLSQITIIITMILLCRGWPEAPEQLFHGMVSYDALGTALKLFICLLTAGVFLFSHDYLEERKLLQGEYFVLGLFALLGMMVMVSANSFLTVYLGLELLSLCLYSMVAFQRDSEIASEAAMKYFVLGALASGMLLYGISMIYGTTGSIEFIAVAKAVSAAQSPHILFVFGVVFIVVGIAFKLGAVPFHMWIPDVYQGAPTAVTLFISTAPKIAAFGMTIRMLVDGLQGVVADWHGMLIVLALLSVSLGNVVAIAQDNIKRMLAYSTIAHMGYLLLGVLSGNATGYASSMFYVITYALMSLGTFGMIIYLGRAGFEADKLNDFKGLSERSPWFAMIMMILMFSLAGVPPFLGFWAKWFVFKEVVAAGYVWLAALAVVFSIIGAYYYLRLVKLMYFDAPEVETELNARAPVRWALSINGMALLLLGLAPGSLMNLCLSVLKTHG